MRVLFCIRSDYLRNFAGDTMQLLKSAEYLRRKGIQVDVNSGSVTDFSQYDIVHLFNITSMGETYKYYKTARMCKRITVITPIYWDMTKYYNSLSDLEGIKLWNKCKIYRNEILTGCKMIYSNSNMEMNMLKNEFGKNLSCKVIYNGVETESEEVPLYNFMDRYNMDGYILCVGRICARKNQLAVAKACKDLGYRLVLVGSNHDREYFNKCMSYDNVTYLGFIDSYNIYNAYRFAKVHVLASFVETPGLSSLEAGASGCNVVSTDEGSAREYFKDMAEYCSPYCEDSIRQAIMKGWKKPKSQLLRNHILKNFDWEKCINELYMSYQELLSV